MCVYARCSFCSIVHVQVDGWVNASVARWFCDSRLLPMSNFMPVVQCKWQKCGVVRSSWSIWRCTSFCIFQKAHSARCGAFQTLKLSITLVYIVSKIASEHKNTTILQSTTNIVVFCGMSVSCYSDFITCLRRHPSVSCFWVCIRHV